MRGVNFDHRRCPNCNGLSRKKITVAPPTSNLGNASDLGVAAAIKYQNRFPYVSTAFPFGGAGAKHVGKLKKCLIESKHHEDLMRGAHDYVGENKVIGRRDKTPTPEAANRAFYG